MIEWRKRGGPVKTQRHLAIVRELRRMLSLSPEAADFSRIGMPPTGDEALPKDEDHVNAFIAARSKLWRESWIFPLLDELEGKSTR